MTDAYQQLVWDLEESLEAEGRLPLHTFSWWLRGQGRGLGEEDVAALCERAYARVTTDHNLRLEWSDGRPAEPGEFLDFDIDTTGEVRDPHLVLVPD